MKVNHQKAKQKLSHAKLSAPLLSYWRERAEKPLVIDISKNCYDLRPAAYAVTNRIESLKELYPHDPLIVPMGESHNHVPSRLLQQAVMQCCIDRGLMPAFSSEENHRMFEQMMRAIGLKLDMDHANYLLDVDPHNRMLRKLMIFGSGDQQDTQAWIFCDERNISIGFNDCVRRPKKDSVIALDYADDVTRQAADDLRYPITVEDLDILPSDQLSNDDLALLEYGGHDGESQTGIHIRNLIMMRKMLEQFRIQKPEVLVAGIGSAHMFGTEYPQYEELHQPKEKSLTALFNANVEERFILLPVQPLFQLFPISAEANFKHAILVNGFDEHEPDRFVGTYIRHVAEQSGGLIEYYTPVTRQDRDGYFEQFKTELERVVGKANSSSPQKAKTTIRNRTI